MLTFNNCELELGQATCTDRSVSLTQARIIWEKKPQKKKKKKASIRLSVGKLMWEGTAHSWAGGAEWYKQEDLVTIDGKHQ